MSSFGSERGLDSVELSLDSVEGRRRRMSNSRTNLHNKFHQTLFSQPTIGKNLEVSYVASFH